MNNILNDFRGWIMQVSTLNIPSKQKQVFPKSIFKKSEIQQVIPQLPNFKLKIEPNFIDKPKKERTNCMFKRIRKKSSNFNKENTKPSDTSRNILIRDTDFVMLDTDLVIQSKENPKCPIQMCILITNESRQYFAVKREYYTEKEIPKEELIPIADSVLRNPVQYGIIYSPYNEKISRNEKIKKLDFDCTSGLQNNQLIYITRNGVPFYRLDPIVDHATNVYNGTLRALRLIEEIKRHPLRFDEIDYDKKLIGRHVWYRSQPAIIKEYIAGRGVFTLEPDKEAGCNGFLIPKEISENMETHEEILPDTLSAVAVEFHDPWVWWYRD